LDAAAIRLGEHHEKYIIDTRLRIRSDAHHCGERGFGGGEGVTPT